MNRTELYNLRKDYKLSQKDFAKLVGKHQVEICRWETGYKGLSDTKLIEIKQILERSGLEPKSKVYAQAKIMIEGKEYDFYLKRSDLRAS